MHGLGDTFCEGVPAYLHLSSALREFATSEDIRGQGHIKPLHQHIALRLVLEGGFLPEEVTPRPPLRHAERGKRHVLELGTMPETSSEKTLIGGLKTKAIDVVVSKPDLGPVVAISVKGTTKAFRNLTNRMEEAIGDCTNLHIMYPGLVYGFFALIRANREGDPGIQPNDVCVGADGQVRETIARYCSILANLSGRQYVRDEHTRYEAVGVLLVEPCTAEPGAILAGFPPSDSPLVTAGFFPTIYRTYDIRYPFMAANMPVAERVAWDEDSPVFEAIRNHVSPGLEEALGYVPRLA